ncbi:MAG: hypothetical protein PF501_01795 [Salinisphaera sp.]|nr:hypothetical protein [Salinisphaera sp.]
MAGERPGIAAGHGYLFGLGLFGVGVGWVHVGLAVFGLGPVAVVLATGTLVGGLALFPAATLALACVLRPRWNAAYFMLAAPAAWVALEWLRGWLFTGFPWLTLGTNQTAGPFGTQLAPIFGVLGLSLLVAVVAVVAVVAGVLAWIGMTRRRYLARGLAFAGVLALAPLTE